jgi:murein DD-endopeptidase MepM/ murein hydrolase activator NlpD
MRAAPHGDEGALPGGSGKGPSTAARTRYTIRPGDTLTTVALRFGTTVESLMDQNGLRNADAIFVGQELLVHDPPQREGPSTAVLPDSAFVRGPGSLDFDPEAWLRQHRGRLSRHRELVDGESLGGPAIVARVSREFSVDARVLLAFIDSRSGWVRSDGGAAQAETPDFAAGLEDPARESLWHQLNWLADRLNGGYYDWKTRDNGVLTLADGVRLAGHPRLNAGSFAVQRALGLQSTEAELELRLDAFAERYQSLFGDPWATALPSLDPASIDFPTLGLPWSGREGWWFTGGPHGGWGDGSAWAAIDFVAPGEQRGCFLSPAWVRAVADGVIVAGGEGELWLDLDGDERRETGPVVLYLHLAAEGRAEAGTRVSAGDPVGHPSCEGGFSTATHLHLARLYDGEWLAAGGASPMILGGWRAEGAPRAYDGRLLHEDGRVREACECRLEGHNDLSR